MNTLFFIIIEFVPLVVLISTIITMLVDYWSHRQSFHRAASHHVAVEQDLQQVLSIFAAFPHAGEILHDYYNRHFQTTRFQQSARAFIGNVISIVIGWLLSAFLDPASIFPFLHR